MQTSFTIQSIPRRTFGKIMAGAAAAFAHVTGGTAQSLPVKRSAFTVYSFYPMDPGGIPHCRACLSHAEHKRFATLEAAQTNRAHPGCDCLIMMTEVSADDYTRMFGGSGKTVERVTFDLRWPATA
jgi:hypothetical protein